MTLLFFFYGQEVKKGEIIFEAAVSGLVEVVEEWRAWPIAERSDQHTQPVQSQIRW